MLTGVTEKTFYRQDWPLQRNAERIERRGSDGTLHEWVAFHYGDPTIGEHQSQWGTRLVQLRGRSTTTYEGGAVGFNRSTFWDYNDYGGVAVETRNDGGFVSSTHNFYDNRPANLDRWILNRLSERKVRPTASASVSEWTKLSYENDLVTNVAELVCDGAACPCFESDDECIGDGARWIDRERDHQYDSYGNLLAVTDALGRTTTYTYDPAFMTYRASETRPLVDNLSAGAESRLGSGGSFLGDMIETWLAEAPVALTVSRTFDASGRVASETDPAGHVTEYGYDAFGRIESIHRSDGGTTIFEYSPWGDANSQSVMRRDTVTNDGGISSLASYFDGDGEVYRVEKSSLGEVEIHQRERLHRSGRRASITSTPRMSADSATGILWLLEELDDRNRPVQRRRVLDANVSGGGADLGVIQRIEYHPKSVSQWQNAGDVDDDGRILNDRWQKTERHFDGRGVVWKLVDSGGRGTLYAYDEARRPSLVLGPEPSLAGATAVELEPGLCSQLACRFFRHDNRGRMLEQNEPESGSRTHVYDDVGNLLVTTDALGQQTERAYDSVDRLLWADGAGVSTSYGYDVGATNGVGRRVWSEYSGGRTEVTSFDSTGRVLEQDIEIDGLAATQTETYAYDLLGRRTRTVLPDGSIVDYVWAEDAEGVLLAVELDGRQMVDYDEFTGPSRPTLRRTQGGETTYSFGADQVIDSITASAGSTELLALNYAHDASGNVRAVADVRQQKDRTVSGEVRSTDDSWSFGYDNLNRLASATFRDSAPDTFAYSGRGDVTVHDEVTFSRSWPNIVGRFNTTNAECRALEGLRAICGQPSGTHYVTATHDAAGNVISKSAAGFERTLAYDALHRLHTIQDNGFTIASFLYDDGERRIRKREATFDETVTAYYVSDLYELRESSSEPGVLVPTRHIIAPGDGLVASVTGDPVPNAPLPFDLSDAFVSRTTSNLLAGALFTFENSLGSAAVVTDASGQELVRYIHDPWGRLIEAASFGVDATPYRFTGKETDVRTGLVYFGARYLDADLARFTSADTIYPGGIHRPLSLNRYAYAFHNPLKYVDPDGHEPVERMGRLATESEPVERLAPRISIRSFDWDSGAATVERAGTTTRFVSFGARDGTVEAQLRDRIRALEIERDDLAHQVGGIRRAERRAREGYTEVYYDLQVGLSVGAEVGVGPIRGGGKSEVGTNFGLAFTPDGVKKRHFSEVKNSLVMGPAKVQRTVRTYPPREEAKPPKAGHHRTGRESDPQPFERNLRRLLLDPNFGS